MNFCKYNITSLDNLFLWHENSYHKKCCYRPNKDMDSGFRPEGCSTTFFLKCKVFSNYKTRYEYCLKSNWKSKSPENPSHIEIFQLYRNISNSSHLETYILSYIIHIESLNYGIYCKVNNTFIYFFDVFYFNTTWTCTAHTGYP